MIVATGLIYKCTFYLSLSFSREVRSFLNDLDPDKEVSDKDLERLMRETDVNNDGSVNFGGRHITNLFSHLLI